MKSALCVHFCVWVCVGDAMVRCLTHCSVSAAWVKIKCGLKCQGVAHTLSTVSVLKKPGYEIV